MILLYLKFYLWLIQARKKSSNLKVRAPDIFSFLIIIRVLIIASPLGGRSTTSFLEDRNDVQIGILVAEEG